METAVNVVLKLPIAVAVTTCTRAFPLTTTRTVTRSDGKNRVPWTASGCSATARNDGLPEARAAGTKRAVQVRSSASLRTPKG